MKQSRAPRFCVISQVKELASQLRAVTILEPEEGHTVDHDNTDWSGWKYGVVTGGTTTEWVVDKPAVTAPDDVARKKARNELQELRRTAPYLVARHMAGRALAEDGDADSQYSRVLLWVYDHRDGVGLGIILGVLSSIIVLGFTRPVAGALMMSALVILAATVFVCRRFF